MSASLGLGLQGPEDRNLPSSRAGEKAGFCQRWLAGSQELPGLQALGMRAWEELVPRIRLKCCWRVCCGFPLGVPTQVAFAILCFPYIPLRLA